MINEKRNFKPYTLLLPAVAGLITGITMYHHLSMHSALLAWCIIVTASSFATCRKQWYLFACFMSIGMIAFAMQQKNLDSKQKSHKEQSDYIARVLASQKIDKPTYKQVLDLQLQQKKEQNLTSWKPSFGTVRLYLSHPSNIDCGDIILLPNISFYTSCNNTQKRPRLSLYLMRERLIYSSQEPFLHCILLHRPSWSLLETRSILRKNIADCCLASLTKTARALYSALFFGEKSSYASSSWKWWGCSHLLARSGLHLSLFLMVLIALLNTAQLSSFTRAVASVSILVCYALLSYPSISFYRGLICSVAIVLAPLLHKRAQSLHLLSLLTIETLCCNPAQLFFLDFQLSYGLTFFILWQLQSGSNIQTQGSLHDNRQP